MNASPAQVSGPGPVQGHEGESGGIGYCRSTIGFPSHAYYWLSDGSLAITYSYPDMKTTSSLIRKLLIRSRGGVGKGPSLKQVKGPSKMAYRGKKG